jgi:hypothetical protein
MKPVDQETSMPDRAKLLDAANSASQNCATLHLAFMALCAYVMVIVVGTTDLDLLVGKGVTLPLLGVAVPIVGFYAAVPLLVVLVHFNLLLQLRFLSRKLYAFDAATPKAHLPLHLAQSRFPLAPRPSCKTSRPLFSLLYPSVTVLSAWLSQKRMKSSGACCFLSHVVRYRLKA